MKLIGVAEQSYLYIGDEKFRAVSCFSAVFERRCTGGTLTHGNAAKAQRCPNFAPRGY